MSMIQHSHPHTVVQKREHGRTQAMLEQVMDDSLTDTQVVVARDRSHARELFSRLKQMGATTRDGDTLKANGHRIFVVTTNQVVADYDGGWRYPSSPSAQVKVDHAALEVMS